MRFKAFLAILLLFSLASPVRAEEGEAGERGTIFTLWPLIDYRESPREGFSNLSILGPLFKLQHRGDEKDVAVRPFFYSTSNSKEETTSTSYLYPIASSEETPENENFQVLKLFQNNDYRKGEGADEQKQTMLFPFYISGTSKKYGPYKSVFPFYGNIYERFWRDEYHFVMFPLYSRTVKKGTTSTNYLYPFFSFIEGEKEQGWQFWPIYGQSDKEGVYHKRFAVWPFFFKEETGLDTDNPTKKLMVLPLYASTESPKRSSRHYLWPFFGHIVDRSKKTEETDYLWPFFVNIKGESRNMDRYIPFYSVDRRKNSVKHWYMWPLYSNETLNTDEFTQDRDRILYFLYSDNRETWTADGATRRRMSFWPLFMYKKDPKGISSFTFPALLEPIVDREGIDKHWAPFWRLYQQRWNEADESAVSILWNLYWHEYRKGDLAFELFPLVAYRSEKKFTDFKFLKGLIRYQKENSKSKLSFFWLPFGIHWGNTASENPQGNQADQRSEK